MGTAIRSSNRFGGLGTVARSRVKVRSAVQAETGTVFPAEQQTSRSRQGQLFPCYVPDVDMRRALEQGVKVGIVSGFGIGAEDRGVHIDVNVGADFGQAAPTLALQHAMKAAPPQVLTQPGGLQLPRYRYRPNQVQIQPIECGIIRLKLPHRANRSPLKVPDVHSQHSRLN